MAHLPLAGITVVEVGQLLAGPFTGTMLAYFGARVIKVEPPGEGDPIRGWRLLDDSGTSYWWRSLGRNKESITLDLRSKAGRHILSELLAQADVVIENFKPGTMEKWGLGPQDLESANPGLIYARISGYGQHGPNSHKPGYASVTEAFSGFRYLNGFPGEPPVRPNLSLGDSIAGIHAVVGILLALQARQKDGQGQVIDVALYEAMFNLMEAVVPEFSAVGAIREPAGSTITGIVPTNTYLCRDGKHVVIGANGESIYRRLMHAIDRADLADDPRLQGNPGRVKHQQLLDGAIAAWTDQHDAGEVITILEQADVPVGPIYNIEDAFNDPHYQARALFENVSIPAGEGQPELDLSLPAILPKLGRTPGSTRWPGGAIGSHTQTVLCELGYAEEDQQRLRDQGII